MCIAGDVAHEFVLGFATEEGLFEPRKEAKRVAALSTVSLGPKTAYVLDPVDDVTFTHEAAFAKGANGKWRKACVFRWLQDGVVEGFLRRHGWHGGALD